MAGKALIKPGAVVGIQTAAGCRRQLNRAGWLSAVNRRQRALRDLLIASVELAVARFVLWEVIALADQVPVLTDEQLLARLLALAVHATPQSPASPMTPAGDRLNPVPGGQPVPPDTEHADLAGREVRG